MDCNLPGSRNYELTDSIFVCDHDIIYICKLAELKEYCNECIHTKDKKMLGFKWNQIQAYVIGADFQSLSVVQSQIKRSNPHEKNVSFAACSTLSNQLTENNNKMTYKCNKLTLKTVNLSIETVGINDIKLDTNVNKPCINTSTESHLTEELPTMEKIKDIKSKMKSHSEKDIEYTEKTVKQNVFQVPDTLSKVLKKKRQCRKTNGRKPKDSIMSSDKPSLDKKSESKDEDEESTNKDEDERSEDSEIEDINFISDSTSTFIDQLYLKTMDKNDVNNQNLPYKKQMEEEKHVANRKDTDTKEIPNPLITELKSPIECITNACELFLKGEKMLATACFTRAIQLQPTNLWHYLNRCYCYLRTNNSGKALDDARYVLEKSNNIKQIAMAHFRMGQAYYRMQNYEMTEQCYEESLKIFPNDRGVQRELMFVKMKQLVNMGFPEKQVLHVLQEHPHIMDACTILTDTTFNMDNMNSNDKSDSEDGIFQSDDEDNLSCSKLLTNLVHCYAQKKNTDKLSQLNEQFLFMSNENNKEKEIGKMQQINTGTIKRIINEPKVINPVKIQMVNKAIDDKVIWIGNLVSDITENMIRKKFNRFGKIVSVVRPNEGMYAFVNFESSIPVLDIVTVMNNCEINGHKIYVHSKPKKT